MMVLPAGSFLSGSPDEWYGWMCERVVMPKKEGAALPAVLTESINTMHALTAPPLPF